MSGLKRKRDRKAPYDRQREAIVQVFGAKQCLGEADEEHESAGDTILTNGDGAHTLADISANFAAKVDKLLQVNIRRVRRRRLRSPSPVPDTRAVDEIAQSFRAHATRIALAGGRPNLTAYLGGDDSAVSDTAEDAGYPDHRVTPRKPQFGDEQATDDIWEAYLRALTSLANVFPHLSMAIPAAPGSETEKLLLEAMKDGVISFPEFLIATSGPRLGEGVAGGSNNMRLRAFPSLPSWAHPVGAGMVFPGGFLPSSRVYLSNVAKRAAESLRQHQSANAHPAHLEAPMRREVLPGRIRRLPVTSVSLESIMKGHDNSIYAHRPVPFAPMFVGGAWTLFSTVEDQLAFLQDKPELFELMDSIDWESEDECEAGNAARGLPPFIPRNEEELYSWVQLQRKSNEAIDGSTRSSGKGDYNGTGNTDDGSKGECTPVSNICPVGTTFQPMGSAVEEKDSPLKSEGSLCGLPQIEDDLPLHIEFNAATDDASIEPVREDSKDGEDEATQESEGFSPASIIITSLKADKPKHEEAMPVLSGSPSQQQPIMDRVWRGQTARFAFSTGEGMDINLPNDGDGDVDARAKSACDGAGLKGIPAVLKQGNENDVEDTSAIGMAEQFLALEPDSSRSKAGSVALEERRTRAHGSSASIVI
ncbi:hypothetical protein K437DRAFT_262138 [Tilletiaria anomala UBC 951]|uniref:Uncharacterized protein n=1 Tax=Tilletiaria anomala (strain ATCC 24038 / CBS 436.72 / UBC 951) TaxID=1037660 RepID=A0A066WCS1_TILAU|nr:uncharacterized protein K437DRAFT_262138 [Tilletiaria anomala UBC 951]KDN48844.1 hypothetical protein K437DRAFT_262138 [Tilletiaria anomala UBC 951]